MRKQIDRSQAEALLGSAGALHHREEGAPYREDVQVQQLADLPGGASLLVSYLGVGNVYYLDGSQEQIERALFSITKVGLGGQALGLVNDIGALMRRDLPLDQERQLAALYEETRGRMKAIASS